MAKIRIDRFQYKIKEPIVKWPQELPGEADEEDSHIQDLFVSVEKKWVSWVLLSDCSMMILGWDE